MNRRIACAAVASVALAGFVAAAQLFAAGDAEAQAAAGRTLSLFTATPFQGIRQGALTQADLRTKIVDGTARHSVFLLGPQMLCEIHTASYIDAAALYEQIRSNANADVNCYGDRTSAPEPTTTFISVKLFPRPMEGHGVFVSNH